MRVEDRVQPIDAEAECLIAKVRRGIDQHSMRTSTEGRSRLSRGSSDRHTLQVHPMVGMPVLVPEPNTRMDACSKFSSILSRLGSLAAVGRDDQRPIVFGRVRYRVALFLQLVA